MVIMLHGLGDSKNIFKPLWRKALEEGYMAAAINYPSTRKDIDSHVRQLDFLLNHLEDVQEVSFVTKGIGGIILRKLMSLDTEWKKKLKIRRIVQVSPPNQGCPFLTKLNQYKIFRFILGPAISQVSAKDLHFIPDFPDNTEYGIISKESPLKSFSFLLPQALRRYLPGQTDAKLPKAKEIIHINSAARNPFKSPKIVNACINFLKNGKFS